MSLFIAMATLLLRNVSCFLEAKLQKMVNVKLILASDVKDGFRFGISAYNSSPEPNFRQISPRKNFKF